MCKNTIPFFGPLTESAISRRFDYADRFPEALTDLSKWISEGRLTRKYHIVEGLEKAPESLPLLFSGGNTGKLFVHPTSCRFPGSLVFLGSSTFPALMQNFEQTAELPSRYAA